MKRRHLYCAKSPLFIYFLILSDTWDHGNKNLLPPPFFFVCVCSPSLSVIHFLKWMSFVTSFFDFPEREKKNATSNPFLTTETIFLLFNFQKKKEKRNLNGNVVLVFFCFFLLFHCGDGTREGCCVQGSTANRFSPTSLDRNGSRSSIVTQSAAWAPPSIHSFFFFFFFSMSFAPITKKPTLENLSDYTTRSASFGRPNDLIPSAILDIIY